MAERDETPEEAWKRRDAVLRGEAKKGEEGKGTSTAESGSSPSFQGDGPAGESISGGVEIASGDEKKK